MITNFEIHNFRGIRLLRLEDITSLNLLLGYNNCGKSSVLEALYLFCDPSHPVNDIQINRARHYLRADARSLQYLFYGLDDSSLIVLDGNMDNGEKRSVEVKYYETERTHSDLDNLHLTNRDVNKTYGLRNVLRQTINGIEKTYNFKVEPRDDNSAQTFSEKDKKDYANMVSSGYMPPNSNSLNYIDSFKEIIENKETDNIVNALREIEPTLIGLNIIDDQIMADIGQQKLIPIQLLGDGIRKLFSIIIFIYQLKGGVAMIDEIDNGLHYKSMPTLWRTIISLAKTYDVQLFITTHNIDSIKALSKVLGDNADFRNDCNIYTLRKKTDGEVLAVRSSYDQLDYMINQEMELR